VLIVPVLKFDTPKQAIDLWLTVADKERLSRSWALLADEADELWPVSLPQRGPSQRVLRAIRNRSQVLYATCNYPQQSSPRLRQSIQHACVFRGVAEEYVDAMSKFGPSRWFDRALELDKFEYLYREPGARAPLPIRHALSSPLPW
jgi:hypothetical protein